VALGDPYATPAELELRLGRTDDGTFITALAAASRDIERYCRRHFNKATTATARQFDTVDRCLALVDDFHTTTDLAIATDDDDSGTFETAWATADYQLEPLSGVVDGVAGWPFYFVRAVNGKRFPMTGRRVPLQVTAQWGWATVPEPVKEACLHAAKVILSNDPGRVVSEAIDGYSWTFAADSLAGPIQGLARYRK
jgi:hypothetical protein